MTDLYNLQGRVAVVTGAAQGIGRGIALTLAQAGAAVVIGDLQDAQAAVRDIKAAGGQALSAVMDTSSPADADALVNLALQTHGSLDILVNNAGIDAPRGYSWSLTNDEWRRVIDVNLSGVFYCSRAALQPMLQAGAGSIVNISSQAARAPGSPHGSPAYAASKAGIIGLTIAMANQVGDKGVRVNAIMPATVVSRDFGWTDEQRRAVEAQHPLGLGDPWDVGQSVLYLVSPASRWVTGTALHLTGGYSPPSPWL